MAKKKFDIGNELNKIYCVLVEISNFMEEIGSLFKNWIKILTEEEA